MSPATRTLRASIARALLGAAVAASALGMTAPHAGAAEVGCNSHDADVTIPLRTFKVVAKWDKKVYKIGDVAKLSMTVTRPSDRDPVTDDGQPLPVDSPTSMPADGVEVGVGIYIGDVFLSGGGITDANGKLVAPVKIQPYAKPGSADETIFAFKRYLTETRCVYVQEFAFDKYTNVFKVVR